jgi:hypothetical protein
VSCPGYLGLTVPGLLACLNKLQLTWLKARAIGFGKLCKKPGLAWLFMASFGWLKPSGQSWHITNVNHDRDDDMEWEDIDDELDANGLDSLGVEDGVDVADIVEDLGFADL